MGKFSRRNFVLDKTGKSERSDSVKALSVALHFDKTLVNIFSPLMLYW